MSADLQFWHPDHLGDAKGALRYRHVNTLNTPIASSSWLGNGAAIEDVYELVFTRAGAAVSCTVEPLIAGTKNPYRNATGVAVVADGATVNRTVVPGVGLVIAAAVDTGWKARVAVANYLEDDGSYEVFFSYGIVTEGEELAGKRVAVKNVGDATAAQAKLYMLPDPRMSGGNWDAFIANIAPHSSPTYHKQAPAGTKTVTYANFRDDPGGSGNKMVDVYVNGALAINGALLDGTTEYKRGVAAYDAGVDGFKGLMVVFRATTADPTGETHSLIVADGSAWTQVASEPVVGTPGTYAAADLDLTASGQPTGTVPSGSAAFLWRKWVVPEGAGPGDMRQGVPRLRSLSV